MAATMLGSLLVSLGLESGTFKSGLTDAERRLKKTGRAFEAQGRRIEAIGRTIGDSIRTLGAAAAGGGIVVLLDSFTKLQNNLRVAGLEGEALKAVQDKLFASAQKYGVALEGLTGLFGKITQSQKELGASQTQILKLTDLTSAALKITGVSSAQSAGAILGLSQAFASGTVKAEEYNQILEGGLQPLLQAVANSEKYGGSLGKLRKAVVDGKVSSQEFFQAILAGADALEGKAAKATTTLAGGVTQLTNAMTVYVGEASAANGVTATLSAALSGLAKNFETIANIGLTVVGIIGVRWVAGLVAATVRTIAFRAAALGMIASLGGVAVAARVAGAALLAAFGGPVGVAMLAIGAALYFVTVKANELTKATGAYAKAQQEAAKITDKAAQVAEKLALAHGKARQEALALARAEAENIKQKLASARASVVLAQAELARARSFQAAQNIASRGSTGVPGTGLFIQGTGDKARAQAEANARVANETVANLTKSLETVTQAINATATPAVAAVGDGKKTKDKKPKGASGPTAEEINRRFNDELVGYAQQVLSARQAMAMNAEEAADLELRGVELARIRTLDGIKAEKDYSAVQKQRLSQEVESLAQAERDRIEFEKNRQIEDEQRELDQQDYNISRDALQLKMDMADTEQERQNIAMQLLGLDQQFRRNALEQIIASDVRTDAEKALAQQALDRLAANEAAEAAATERQNETRVQAYMRMLNKTPGQINEAIDQIKINGLEALNDALVDAVLNFKSLADVARNVVRSVLAELLRLQIQQAIIKPLAAAIGLPGFASGTNFAPGGLALVGERGPEVVNLPRGSQVIPNHELSGFGGRQEVHKPTFVFPGVTNERMARESAGQAARRYRSEINGMRRA